MAYWDNANKEFRTCLDALDEFYDRIQHKRNPRALRTMEQRISMKKNESIISKPFPCMGEQLFHTVHLEYERYRDPQGKIRERGIFTLTLSNKHRDLRHFFRGHYEDEEEWLTEKQVVKDGYKVNLGWYLWSRPTKLIKY